MIFLQVSGDFFSQYFCVLPQFIFDPWCSLVVNLNVKIFFWEKMVVHILIVYADFSRCRARFSWWDFVTTASPRKFEISYHYTCSSLFWHCYKMDRKRHLFWLKRSKGLEKTPIFYLLDYFIKTDLGLFLHFVTS